VDLENNIIVSDSNDTKMQGEKNGRINTYQ